MADYYTTMANMKKAAREDDMAAKNGKGLSDSIQSVGSSAKLAMMKESERAKAMEKGAAMSAQLKESASRGAQLAAMKESERAMATEKGAAVSAKLKGGPLPTKTVAGPAKK